MWSILRCQFGDITYLANPPILPSEDRSYKSPRVDIREENKLENPLPKPPSTVQKMSKSIFFNENISSDSRR